MKREFLVAQPLVSLADQFETYSDYRAFGVSCNGSIYVAARKTSELSYETRSEASFPKSRLEEPSEYMVLAWHDGESYTRRLSAVSIAAHFIQPHPDGLLLAGARCWWRPDGAEENAVVFDANGEVIRRMTLGDGISDLRVTPDGTIWASYFDEGVSGNYGWRGPGPEPIGSSGLVGFSSDGTAHFSYSAYDAGTDEICDVYAMNVTGNADLWICFYTDLSIVRINDGAYRSWEAGFRGVSALAVHGAYILLYGDYDQGNLIRIIQLNTDGTVGLRNELELVDDHGRPITGVPVYGVGDEIYVFGEQRVLTVRDWWPSQ